MTKFKKGDLVSVDWNGFQWRVKEIFTQYGKLRASLQYVFPLWVEVNPARQVIELHGSRQAKYTNHWFRGRKIGGTNVIFDWQNRLNIFKQTWSKGLRVDWKTENKRKRVLSSAWIDNLRFI